MISVDIDGSAGGWSSVLHVPTTQEGTANPDGTFSLSGNAGGAAVGAAFDCDWSITVNEDPQITSTSR